MIKVEGRGRRGGQMGDNAKWVARSNLPTLFSALRLPKNPPRQSSPGGHSAFLHPGSADIIAWTLVSAQEINAGVVKHVYFTLE
ncbi:hypothetical protein RRG08_065026 [Elysia crispata]|uniref:Uncharacterized protein n=1 Tax=Elysia crispata TaxID=231223 RepID=A0AAE0YQN5_9GAST|nr:hypothetical protein RRG08_065026 [Elysia crispata]